MPNQLQLRGAQSGRPSRYTPLYTGRFFSGLWTQRNALRDAGSSHLEESFYGARGDGLIDGLNIELSNRLTPVRRPGLSVYNSAIFPQINYFYEFRVFNANTETIKLLADTASTIIDATGPSTNTTIFTKSGGAGRTYFQSVGNTLYFSDGVDTKKWIQSVTAWTPNTRYFVGEFIVDPNGNLQQVVVDHSTTGPGISGNVEPTWNTTYGAITEDPFMFSPRLVWQNLGNAIQNWGIAAPTTAPTTTQQAVSSSFASWVANSWYAPAFVIVDTNNNLQLLQAPGTNGASQPTWNPSTGGATSDGGVAWTNLGSAARLASTAYSSGAYIRVNIGSTSAFFQTEFPGGSTSALPTTSIAWPSGLGSTVIDGGVTWVNVGAAATWTTIGGSQSLIGGSGLGITILDSNGYVQTPTVLGKTGSSAPTWNTHVGSYTVDNTQIWRNLSAFAPASTAPWTYAYSYQNPITGGISTASPLSTPIIVVSGNNVVVQGAYSTDPQVGNVVIWRTVQGGSILLFDALIPNIVTGSTWTYTDTVTDTGLNNLIEAPIALSNNPPPVGLSALTYHLGRIWGAGNNTVYYSGGPDTLTGNGNETFPPLNSFVFPSRVTRLYASAIGLMVFTVSDIYVISGSGTSTSRFVPVIFSPGVGLASYDAFDVNGATFYLFTSDRQVVSLDISSGVSEIGFPIGDQFDKANFHPATARATWHIAGSADKGLYVADGSTGWFRLCPTPAPEQGMLWSPFAAINGGCGVVQSVETSPGTHTLLVTPTGNGPIFKRDREVFTDHGSPYDAYGVWGSYVLCQPGQLADVRFVVLEAINTGSPVVLSVQLDEIAPLTANLFETLSLWVPDPTELSPSTSMYQQRFYLSQTNEPTWCRSMQMKIGFGTDTVQNELLTLSIFGAFNQES